MTLTYPDGRVITQTFSGAPELLTLNCTASCGSASPSYLTPAGSGGFDAAGHMVNAAMGNGVQITSAYNNRESISSLTYAATQKLWSKQYAWYPNQNLQLITDAISGLQREFTYDNLNRAADRAGLGWLFRGYRRGSGDSGRVRTKRAGEGQ